MRLPVGLIAAFCLALALVTGAAPARAAVCLQVTPDVSLPAGSEDILLVARRANCPTPASASTSASASEDARTQRWRARYERIRERARRLRIDPQGFAAYAALRFIRRSGWQENVRAGRARPERIYSDSWAAWWETTDTRVRGAAERGDPLSIELLLQWNRQAVERVGGEWLRRIQNVAVEVERPLAPDEIRALFDVKLSDGVTSAIAGFTRLRCESEVGGKPAPDLEHNPDCRALFGREFVISIGDTPPPAENAEDDQDRMAIRRGDARAGAYACWPAVPAAQIDPEKPSCGLIKYTPRERSIAEVSLLIEEANRYLDCPGGRTRDVVEFATLLQRRYVAMHPTRDGNGRTSRWIRDYVLQRSALPPLLDRDTYRDLTVPWTQYLEESRQGMDEALTLMERCLDEWSRGPVAAGRECSLLPSARHGREVPR